MASNEGDKITEGPQIRHQTWFALALSAFVITIVIGGFAAAWVFLEEDPVKMVQRAQAFTPFGAALLAIVTFCTVAWRGEMNRQQLDQQIRQNDANDDANYAKLLQEGAKLLGQLDNQAHQRAGIATLEVLFNDPKKRFAVEAMDLLAGHVAAIYAAPENRQLYVATASALNRGAALGIRSRTSVHFDAKKPDFRWIAINGLALVRYTGGTFGKELTRFSDEESVNIERSQIFMQTVSNIRRFAFLNCTFFRCKIREFDGDDICINVFDHCNFSNAKISRPVVGEISLHERSEGNYVVNQAYPNGPDGFDWSSILANKPRPSP